MLIITGQSKAKKRVFAFLTVFVMTGVLSKLENSIAMYGLQIVLPRLSYLSFRLFLVVHVLDS